MNGIVITPDALMVIAHIMNITNIAYMVIAGHIGIIMSGTDN
jgi:hypothetical protein